MDQYTFEGTTYNVAPHRLEEFLSIYPNAEKINNTKDIAKEKAKADQNITKTFFDDSGREYALDDDGGRLYFSTTVYGGVPRFNKEVSYEYDRSKGIRLKNESYGKIIDDFVNNIGEFVVESAERGQSQEYTDVMADLIFSSDIDQKKASDVIKVLELQQEKGISEDLKEWTKIVDEAKNPFYGFFKATLENPKAAAEVTISSAAGQYNAFMADPRIAAISTTTGVASSKLGGPIIPLRVAAGLRGTMSTLGGFVETTSKIGELIKEEFGGRIPTEEELIELVQDDERFNKIRNKSLVKGVTITAVDNFGGQLVQNRAVKQLAKGKKTRSIAEAVVGETIVGGGGEALSSALIGEEIKASDVGLEIVGQLPQGAIDIGGAIVSQASYEINGKKATLKQVNKVLETATPEELSKINIKVNNNPSFENTVRNKINNAVLEAQIDTRVSDINDRKKLVDLEKQRAKAEADTKKTGVFKVVDADINLQNIQTQIDDIINKYSGVDRRTKDVRARKETAQRVRQNVADKNFEVNMEFAKKHSELYGLEFNDTMTAREIAEKYNETAAKSNGFIDYDNNVIIINKEVARTKGIEGANVANHELLHGIIKASGKKIKQSVIEDFRRLIGVKNNEIIQKRIDDNKDVYTDEYLADNPDEILTIASDAIASRDISFNDNVFDQLRDVFRRAFASLGFSKVNFETAQGVYDFLKDYNRSIHKGALSSGVIKATKGQVKGEGLAFSRPSLIKSVNDLIPEDVKTKKQYDEFISGQEINPETGKRYIPRRNKEIFEAITEKNRVINNYIRSKQTSQDEGNIIIQNLTDRVLGFNPEATRADGTKVGTKGFAERIFADARFSKLDARKDLAIEAKRERPTDIGETTKEGDVKIQVAAEPDAQQEVFETENLSFAGRAKKRAEAEKQKQPKTSKLRRAIGIETGSELYNKVLNTSKKALIRAYETGKPARKIQVQLRNEANTYIFKDIKNFLGTTQYIPNLKKFREPIVEALFTSDLVQLEREVPNDQRVFTKFVKRLTNIKEVESAVNQNLLPPSDINRIKKGQSVSLYKKVMPTEDQFIAFFDQPAINPVTGARSGLKGTRKDGLSKYLSGALSMDATMQIAKDPEVAQKRLDFAELRGETLAEDDLQTLAVTIGRDQDLVFSFSSKDYNTINNSVKIKKLTNLQAKNKFLTVLDKKIDEAKKDNDNYTETILTELREVFDLNIDLRDTRISDIPFTDVTDIDAIINDVKNTNLPEIRNIGHKAFVKLLDNANLATVKTFIKNVFRSSRSASGVMSGFSNEVLKTEVLDKIQIDPKTGKGKFEDEFKLVKTKLGQSIADKNGKIIELYEDIENIKTNARNNKELVEKVNKQANEARAFILDLIQNPNLTRGEKIAMIHLIAYDQRGAIRKASKIGITLKENSILKNKDLTLEHEITVNETVNTLIDYVNDSKSLSDVENLFDKSFVHVLPNYIENKLPKTKGGFERYNNIIQDLISDENITLTLELEQRAREQSNQVLDNVMDLAYSTAKETKGITILDFDDTLATTKSMIRFTRPDGTQGKLNAEQYAATYEDLLNKNYKFDFSEFNKVVDGKPAPLLNKAKKLASKFGTKDMFILTARPQQSAVAIQNFLKQNGLDIPIQNITGLGNSTSEAKALWVLNKAEEGYNDFYFADDAIQNVQAVKNMLDQIDVKSKIQQARLNFSKSADQQFNDILQDVTNIDSKKRYSQAKARKRGQGKGRFRFFIPPSHEDFVGILYNFIGKGEAGNKHRDFFEKALIKPLNRSYRRLNAAKQAIANDYKALIKENPEIRKQLLKQTPDGDYIFSDAVRVYLFNKAGFKIPGLSKTDETSLINLIQEDKELKTFADKIGIISKQKEGYIEPGEHWQTGDIRTDLADATGRVGRKQFFTEFIENSENIFGKMVNGKLTGDNINKIEAAYGENFRQALEDVLHRTITGTNRTVGPNKLVNRFLDYLNGSVGATMFFNARSAVLQTISTVNFINFGDNNIFKAASAFSNQKQFWQDFSMIFNSNFLKQRRAGVAFDVNASEIASAVSKSKQPVRAAIAHILQVGFLPTQMADSFAIALGGSSMYRNRVNTYLNQGLSQKDAESKAFTDFQEIAEATQQSARPDMVSQQQASPLGRMILAFQNVTSQYARLMKKAGLDLINRRKTPPYDSQAKSDMSNISKIIYYGAIQNIIFYSLQTALFAMMFDDDDQDEEFFDKKRDRVINGSIDSILRGMGVGGAIISTIKNTAIKWAENQKKDWGKEDNVIMMEMLQLSPPVGIKARKLSSAEKTLDYNRKVIEEMETFDIDNPMWDAISNIIEATTNIPLARLHRKTTNLREAANSENEWWQRLAMSLGWSRWDVGVENKEVEEVKKSIKRSRKRTRRTSR